MLGAEDFTIFQPPDGDEAQLEIEPRLESWDAASHPSQVALTAFLDHACTLLNLRGEDPGPLAIKLEVGLPVGTLITGGGRDLDNYLMPLARRIGSRRVCSAWAEKRIADRSAVWAAPAQQVDAAAVRGMGTCSILTTDSGSSRAWKEEIAAVVPADEIEAGPVEVQIGFIVHPDRNWLSLWKPAIDSLTNILGTDDPRPFHPRDDRIVRLGLHRQADPSVGWGVGVGVWWRPVEIGPVLF